MPFSSLHNMFSYSVLLIWVCFIRLHFYPCFFSLNLEIFDKIHRDSVSSMTKEEELPMNRRARFSELWKWISSYSESIRLSSHGVRARSIPTVSTVDCECIRCKMQKTISVVYRSTNSGMSGKRKGRKEGGREKKGILEFEFENLWKCIFPRCECWLARLFTSSFTNTNILPVFCKIVKLTFDYARPITDQIRSFYTAIIYTL